MADEDSRSGDHGDGADEPRYNTRTRTGSTRPSNRSSSDRSKGRRSGEDDGSDESESKKSKRDEDGSSDGESEAERPPQAKKRAHDTEPERTILKVFHRPDKQKSRSTSKAAAGIKVEHTGGNDNANDGGVEMNHDICDACGDGGELLCCDNCPNAFHFECVNPPLDPDNLPEGDWFCSTCLGKMGKIPPAKYDSRKLGVMAPIFDVARSQIPKVFVLPASLRRSNTGEPRRNEVKSMDMFDICGFLGSSVQRYAVEDKAEFSRMKNKTKQCNICSDAEGELVKCATCKKAYHRWCLEPMFTSTTARFHCPEHKRRDDDDLADTNDKVTLDLEAVRLDFHPRSLPAFVRTDAEEEEPASDEDFRPAASRARQQDKGGEKASAKPQDRAMRMTEKEKRLRDRQEAEERNRLTTKRSATVMEKLREWFVIQQNRRSQLSSSQFDEFIQFMQSTDEHSRASIQSSLEQQIGALLATKEPSLFAELQGEAAVTAPFEMHDYFVGSMLPASTGTNPFWRDIARPLVPPPANQHAANMMQGIQTAADVKALLDKDPALRDMLAMQRLIQIAKVQIPDAIHLQQMDAPQIKTLAEPKKMFTTVGSTIMMHNLKLFTVPQHIFDQARSRSPAGAAPSSPVPSLSNSTNQASVPMIVKLSAAASSTPIAPPPASTTAAPASSTDAVDAMDVDEPSQRHSKRDAVPVGPRATRGRRPSKYDNADSPTETTMPAATHASSTSPATSSNAVTGSSSTNTSRLGKRSASDADLDTKAITDPSKKAKTDSPVDNAVVVVELLDDGTTRTSTSALTPDATTVASTPTSSATTSTNLTTKTVTTPAKPTGAPSAAVAQVKKDTAMSNPTPKAPDTPAPTAVAKGAPATPPPAAATKTPATPSTPVATTPTTSATPATPTTPATPGTPTLSTPIAKVAAAVPEVPTPAAPPAVPAPPAAAPAVPPAPVAAPASPAVTKVSPATSPANRRPIVTSSSPAAGSILTKANSELEDPFKDVTNPAERLTPHRQVVRGVLVWFGLDNQKHFYYFTDQKKKCAIGRHVAAVDIDMSKYTDVKTVSHKHAEIELVTDSSGKHEWFMENFGRNGTRVNTTLHGKQPTAQPGDKAAAAAPIRVELKSGDRLEIGKVYMRLYTYTD